MDLYFLFAANTTLAFNVFVVLTIPNDAPATEINEDVETQPKILHNVFLMFFFTSNNPY